TRLHMGDDGSGWSWGWRSGSRAGASSCSRTRTHACNPNPNTRTLSECLVEAEVERGRLAAGTHVDPHRHPALHAQPVADAEVGQQAVQGVVPVAHRAGADPGHQAVEAEERVSLGVVAPQVHPAQLEQGVDGGAVAVAALAVAAQVVRRTEA